MSKKFTSHHGAVMVEPVIVITFFAVISVFLLRMFASTEKLRSGAEEMSKSVIRAESVMEYVLATGNAEEDLDALGFTETKDDTGTYLVKYFDKDWQETDRPERYTMKVYVNSAERGNGTLVNYIVHVLKTDNTGNSVDLITLSTKKYLSGGGNR